MIRYHYCRWATFNHIMRNDVTITTLSTYIKSYRIWLHVNNLLTGIRVASLHGSPNRNLERSLAFSIKWYLGRIYIHEKVQWHQTYWFFLLFANMKQLTVWLIMYAKERKAFLIITKKFYVYGASIRRASISQGLRIPTVTSSRA